MIPQDHHEENYSSRTTQIFIPRVLPNQRHRFETEDFFRKSAQTSEVMYQKLPPNKLHHPKPKPTNTSEPKPQKPKLKETGAPQKLEN